MKAVTVAGYSRQDLEHIRISTDNEFKTIQSDWLEQLRWTNPARAEWIASRCKEKKNRYIIVDGTHVLAQRSFVAGFLEGNTSASRPWYRYQHPDPDRNRFTPNRSWLDMATMRAMGQLGSSNFYLAAGEFYNDYASVNTGAHVIQKKKEGGLHFHTLVPGSYRVVNNAMGEAVVLVREFTLTAKAIVDEYGVGDDWSNISDTVKKCYENSDYIQTFDICEIYIQNKSFDAGKPIGGMNRQWATITYELGVSSASGYNGSYVGDYPTNNKEEHTYLRVSYSRKKNIIVGKSQSSDNYAYGQRGPTTDAIGLIRSLNKKAIAKDVAIEKMLDPTTQGPASLRKTYLTTQARKYIPLDPTALAQGGIKTAFDINPAIGPLTMDVEDMRRQVEKFYYSDFLMYLSMNPKTRTATETQAIINEQQMVIGPNLQSLNWSYNMPIAEFMLDYVIHEDPYLPPPPEDLQGEWINTEFISVFAQVQKAADLPMINQFLDRWVTLAQINPKAWDNINIDELGKIYTDRYYLPAGLMNDQNQIDAIREQAQKDMQRQQMIEAIPQIGAGARDMAQAQAVAG